MSFNILPNEIVEIIARKDSKAGILLSMVEKRVYGLFPQTEHLTYPEYLAALTSGDFLSVYKSKDGYTWYRGEWLNLRKDHHFVKYLKHHGRKANLYAYDPYRSKGVIFSYITGPCPKTQYEAHEESIFDYVTCWALENQRYVSEKCIKEQIKSEKIHMIYAILNSGLYIDEVHDLKTVELSMLYYAYGKLTLQQMMDGKHEDKNKILGLVSHDYPEEILEYFGTIGDKKQQDILLDYAMKVNSRMLLPYIKRYPKLSAAIIKWLIKEYGSQVVTMIDLSIETNVKTMFRLSIVMKDKLEEMKEYCIQRGVKEELMKRWV